MVDAHTHLDLCEAPEAQLVDEAEAAGVGRMLTIGIDGGSCRAALAAAESFPQVYAAVGRHPNSAKGFDDADLAELRALAAHPRCVAIGETGLDFYRAGAPQADQQRAFAAQIALARETGKPLVIHSRAAEILKDDCRFGTTVSTSARANGRSVLPTDRKWWPNAKTRVPSMSVTVPSAPML